MKDPEFGETHRDVSQRQKTNRTFVAKKTLTIASLALSLASVMFGIVLLASHCDHLFSSQKEIVLDEKAFTGAKHQLDRRSENCDEVNITSGSPVAAATAEAVAPFSVTHFLTDGSIAIVTQSGESSDEDSIVSIPISTIYSISSAAEPTTTTVKTTTKTTSITISPETICSAWNATLTVTVTVVPTPTSPASSSLPWASSSVLGDVTVTGGASTVTDVNTDVPYTSGLPDATISGNPSTATDVQTQVSFTSGLPDATVPGNPSTLTNVQTDISLTTGLPDVTVSGNPSTVTDVQVSTSLAPSLTTSVVTVVISDLWSSAVSSPAPMVTVTEISTVKTTVTTVGASSVIVTVTNYPVPGTTDSAASSAKGGAATATSTAAQSTITEFVTTTSGEPVTSVTTVFIPSASYPGANGTMSGFPSGTATSINIPATPIIVSGGNKKPEPYAWGSGSGNLGCVMMLIAVMMFML